MKVEFYKVGVTRPIDKINNGDIFSVEYGAYGSYANVIFEGYEISNNRIRVVGTQINRNGDIIDKYWSTVFDYKLGNKVPMVDIVGKVVSE